MGDKETTPPLEENLKKSLDGTLDEKDPPVGRARLLSEGMKPYHRIELKEDEITGDQGCLACGNCIDSCPVLRREPERFEDTAQRTSFALESTVGEDCEQCYSCILACPQVETNIKDYVVDEKIVETIPQSETWSALDYYLTPFFALVVGLVCGMFLVR